MNGKKHNNFMPLKLNFIKTLKRLICVFDLKKILNTKKATLKFPNFEVAVGL
jgi:hypothetical protein